MNASASAPLLTNGVNIQYLDGVNITRPPPTNGQALVFNSTTNTWVAGAPSGAGSLTPAKVDAINNPIHLNANDLVTTFGYLTPNTDWVELENSKLDFSAGVAAEGCVPATPAAQGYIMSHTRKVLMNWSVALRGDVQDQRLDFGVLKNGVVMNDTITTSFETNTITGITKESARSFFTNVVAGDRISFAVRKTFASSTVTVATVVNFAFQIISIP